MSKRIFALSGVLAIALVAAGCGGSDDTTTASITKAQFLKQGNAICSAGSKQINTDFSAYAKENHLSNQQPTQAQATEIANTILLPSVQKQVDGIRALGVPAGDSAQVNAILDAAQGAIDQGKKDPASLVQGGADPFAKANKLAAQYGLTACGANN